MKRTRVWDIFLLAVVAFALAGCGGSDGEEGRGSVGLLSASESPFDTSELARVDPAATFSAAVAVNRNNAIVGVSDGGAETVRGAGWTVTSSGGAVTSGVLALPSTAAGWSAAYGINDLGSIVGEMELRSSGATVGAFWSSRIATARALPSLAGSAASAAYAINAAGRIVGDSLQLSARGFDSAAVTWATRSSSPARLPVPAGTISSSAFSINRNGVIAGEIVSASGTRAALWRPVSGRYSGVLLLPAPAGNSTAQSINDLGVIAGEAVGSDGRTHAVRWVPAGGNLFTRVDLGASGVSSSAAGINRGALTVGNIKGADEFVSTATAWDGTTNEASAVAPGYAFSQVYSANDGGLTVGTGDGKAFVAVPK